MRALFVQHDHVSPVGPIGARLSEHGYDVEELVVVPEDSFHQPGVDVEFPDPTRYDVIVPMGAPWSVYDHDLIGAWALPELDFLRDAHTAGVPVLGICFGGQALAAALGGAVVASPEVEVGWHAVDTDEPDLVEAGPWFQWHQDRWVAPEGARSAGADAARGPGVRRSAAAWPSSSTPSSPRRCWRAGSPTAAATTSSLTGSTRTPCSTRPPARPRGAERPRPPAGRPVPRPGGPPRRPGDHRLAGPLLLDSRPWPPVVPARPRAPLPAHAGGRRTTPRPPRTATPPAARATTPRAR